MKISSHLLLIQAVTESVFAVCAKSPTAFSLGVCFGYASAFVEAIQANMIERFYARMRGELDETAAARHQFFFGIAVHQNPELFPEKFPPKTNLVLQNITTSSAVTAPANIQQRGGLGFLMKHAGCYDLSGLKDSLSVVHQMFVNHLEEGTFLLIGGGHVIGLHMQQSRACVGGTMNPVKPQEFEIKNDDDLLALSKEIMMQLSSASSLPASQKHQNHLVITWHWVCCRDDLFDKTPVRNAIRNNHLFSQEKSIPLANIPDKKGRSWILAALKTQELSRIKQMLTLYPSLKKEKEINLGLVSLAAYYHLPEALSLLLKEGEDANVLEETGYRPLHYAIFNCDIQIFKLLLELGADKSLGSSHGLKPLTYTQVLMRTAKEPEVKQKYQEMLDVLSPVSTGAQFATAGNC